MKTSILNLKNKKDYFQLVKEEYSNSEVVEFYTKVGLFPAEEKIFDTYFQPGTKLLDIGCGAGRTTLALVQKGFEIVGIDLIPEMIDSARKQAEKLQLQIDFRVENAVEMHYETESFDNILFSFNGFDTIPGKLNRMKVFQKVYNALKPAGYFIFTTRSGLAPGRRWIAWVSMFFLCLFPKYRTDGQSLELGDKVFRGQYLFYTNPIHLKKLTQQLGFQLVYFNSEKNIVNGKKANFFTNFSGDRMLFYVLRKSA